MRLLVAKGDTVIMPDFGNGHLLNVGKELIDATIAIAATESPFIDSVSDIKISQISDEEIRVEVKAVTITGDPLTVPLKLG